MISFFVAFILFIVTIPLKTALFSAELALTTIQKGAERATRGVRGKINSTPEGRGLANVGKFAKEATNTAVDVVKKAPKAAVGVTKATIVAIKLLIKVLKLLITIIKCAIQVIVALASTIVGLIILVVIILAGTCGAIIVMIRQNEEDALKQKAATEAVSKDREITGEQGYSFTANASVQEIINMSESEVWALISEGRFGSKQEAYDAINANEAEEKKFWEGMLVDVSVPVWVWTSTEGSAPKEASKKNIRVNKHLSEYFESYMTDVYNCKEQYVIKIVGGYSWRKMNNADGAKATWSAHCFGVVLDINYETDGMMSYSATGSEKGIPWHSTVGLPDPELSECCCQVSSWWELTKKYDLDWGGSWSKKYLDPMHFSLVGDQSKDSDARKKHTIKETGRKRVGG